MPSNQSMAGRDQAQCMVIGAADRRRTDDDPSAAAAAPDRPRRRAWTPSVVGTTVVLGFVGLSLRLFVWPPVSIPAHVDAVVALAGGSGRRAATAEALHRAGFASTLLISSPPGSTEARRCRQLVEEGVAASCFAPRPSRTVGEARRIAQLAEENGWESLMVVTSTTHMTRARLLIEQCYEGQVRMIDAGAAHRGVREVMAVVEEWLALLGALTFDRAC